MFSRSPKYEGWPFSKFLQEVGKGTLRTGASPDLSRLLLYISLVRQKSTVRFGEEPCKLLKVPFFEHWTANVELSFSGRSEMKSSHHPFIGNVVIRLFWPLDCTVV